MRLCHFSAWVCGLASLVFSCPGAAQTTIAYDTLSSESPVAVTCGFCAGEKLGVIFRNLPAPARGLDATDFPIQLEAVQLALASADAVGSGASFTCSGSTVAGAASVGMAIYAGTTLPSDILDLEADDVWPGETLIWSRTEVPVERSVADMEGSASYDVSFNRLLLEDDAGLPFRVEPPNVYIRVVVSLEADTVFSSASCDALGLEPPGAFAIRDNDGVIANQRNFIYADGLGWLWSEDVPGGGISGDWALRLEVIAEGGRTSDAGTTPDASAPDTGMTLTDATTDAATPPMPEEGGCGCRTATRKPSESTGAAVLFVIASVWFFRRTLYQQP